MEKLNIIPIGNSVEYIKTTKVESNHHEVFLDEEISEPSNYRELISLLFNASESDSFNVYINTIGGSLSTTMAIVEAIKHCQADVNGILMGETHSGGSMIAMYCHNLIVLDSAEMMIHTANYGTVGTVGNVKSHTEFTSKKVDAIIDNTYEGFLTPEEIQDVKKGIELWFDASEIRERMERRFEILSKKVEPEAENSTEE